MPEAGRVGFLAFGILLLLVGGALALADLLPPGPLLGPLIYTGWTLLALGTTLVIVHVAVGPPRGPGSGEAQR